MSDLFIPLLKILGIVFGVLLLSFTGYQTWSLLYEVTGNPIIAAIGLATFEGGMLYWWFHFQKKAEGLFQLVLSLLGFLYDLFMVMGATALHLGAVDPTIFGSATPAKLVTVAIITNITLELLMPLFSPDTMLKIKGKAAEGKILQASFKKLDTTVDDMSAQLAASIADDMFQDLQLQVLSARKRPNIIPGEAYHIDPNGRRTPLTAFEPWHQPEPEPNGHHIQEATGPAAFNIPTIRTGGKHYQVRRHIPNGRRGVEHIGEDDSYNTAHLLLVNDANTHAPGTEYWLESNGRPLKHYTQTDNGLEEITNPPGPIEDPTRPTAAG